MVHEARLVGTAIMFLTRLPVGTWCSGDPGDLARSTRWFPLVGLLIGSLIALVYYLASLVFPVSVSVVLMLVAGVLLTGAFHEDGLADVADSAGAFGLDAKLEIMRDSRVGTYGSLALILLVSLKGVLLIELASDSLSSIVSAVIIAHVWSRWSSVCLMFEHEYARPEAANKVVAEGVGGWRFGEATVLCLVIVLCVIFLFGINNVVWATGLPYLAAYVCGWYFKRAFGGITGDCLGAANQVVEIAVLLGAVFVLA